MRTYAEGLALLDSKLLPGERKGGLLWMEKIEKIQSRKDFKQIVY